MYSVQVCICMTYFCTALYIFGSGSALFANITADADEFLYCRLNFLNSSHLKSVL